MTVKKQKENKPKAAKAGKTVKGSPSGNVEEKILTYLFTMHDLNMKAVDEKLVLSESGYARTDSTGYRKAWKKLAKDLEYVEKNSGKVSLTAKGLDHMMTKNSQGGVTKVVLTNKEHQQGIQEKILKAAKKAPEKALKAIWSVLEDCEVHSQQELLEAAGYKRADSTGYREVMKWLKTLDLMDSNTARGSFRFERSAIFPYPA